MRLPFVHISQETHGFAGIVLVEGIDYDCVRAVKSSGYELGYWKDPEAAALRTTIIIIIIITTSLIFPSWTR